MKKTDKILIAFLVSASFYSTAQAGEYVQSLTSKEKQLLVSIAITSPGATLTCGMATQLEPPTEGPSKSK